MAKYKEKIMEMIFLLAACVSILAVALICAFLFANGVPAMKEIGFADFLLGKEWRPGNDVYNDHRKYLCDGRSDNHRCACGTSHRGVHGQILSGQII